MVNRKVVTVHILCVGRFCCDYFFLFFFVGYDMPFEENPDFNAPFLLIFYWLPCGYFSSWPYVWQYIHLSGQVKESPRVR